MLEFFAQLAFWSALSYVILSWSGNVPLVDTIISHKYYGLLLSAFIIGFIVTVVNMLIPVVYLIIGLVLILVHRRMVIANDTDGVVNTPAAIRYGVIVAALAAISLLFV